MRILDRYILKSVISILLLCLGTFLFLYIIIDVFSHLDEILKHKALIRELIDYYLSNLPIIFVRVVPFSCLLATLYTFGKLNHDNELIAMRSSGLHILQISRPVIIFGVIASLVVFWVNNSFVPRSLAYTERVKDELFSENQEAEKHKPQTLYNVCMYGSNNRLFSVTAFSTATETMEGITILEHDAEQNLTRKVVAAKGTYLDGKWIFHKVISYDFDEEVQVKGEPRYEEEQIMDIRETPTDFINQKQKPAYMNIAQLKDYLRKFSESNATSVIRRLKVDLFQRFTEPFSSLVIILLGIPFSLKMRKRATGLSSVGVLLIVGFLFYVTNAVSVAFGYAGFLPPWLAVSLTQILTLIISFVYIARLP